jgi:hypothetical protein
MVMVIPLVSSAVAPVPKSVGVPPTSTWSPGPAMLPLLLDALLDELPVLEDALLALDVELLDELLLLVPPAPPDPPCPAPEPPPQPASAGRIDTNPMIHRFMRMRPSSLSAARSDWHASDHGAAAQRITASASMLLGVSSLRNRMRMRGTASAAPGW